MTTDVSMPPQKVDDRLLDRLVDGELTPAERAAALSALGSDAEGWRRCALAFLEAQAWRGALDRGAEPKVHAVVRPARRPMRIARLGTIAAAIVVAFLTGFVLRGGAGFPPGGSGPHDAPYAVNARQSNSANEAARPAAPARALEPWMAVADSGSRLRLPVFAADGGAAPGAETLRQTSALPEYVRRQLERQGYEIEGNRQLVSLALGDGRNVTVPVERLKYRYVGYRVH
jgi:hypothetical protein